MYRFAVFQVLTGLLGGIIASKKGRSPLFWGFLCFIFPPLIFVIGFAPAVVRPGKTRGCPYCGKVLGESDTDCRYCGKQMPIDLIKCGGCGSYVPDRDYCMQCHRKLKGWLRAVWPAKESANHFFIIPNPFFVRGAFLHKIFLLTRKLSTKVENLLVSPARQSISSIQFSLFSILHNN